ncbi:PP2C family protein-serine/threonine phosphatase [Wenjunlia vitaminophila]|nr:PP2C family protein-serine/threonine phosphatase [Wenjunlia vitaminophila]
MIPVVLLLALAVVNTVLENRPNLGLLLAAIPPLAALWYGPVATAVFGAAALGILLLPMVQSQQPAKTDIVVIASVSLASAFFAQVRMRREAQLVSVRTVAEVAQMAVLPPLPERVAHVRCGGIYRAALRGTLVGGDLFDVRRSPYGVRALVGDVQGHGLAAVDTVSAILGAFREAVLDMPDLAGVADRLDRRLLVDAADARDERHTRRSGGSPAAQTVRAAADDRVLGTVIAQHDRRKQDDGPESSELLATAVLLEFPSGQPVVRVISRGHPPPLLLRGNHAAELPVEPDTPLGLGMPVPAPSATLTMTLRPGDRLLVHTDGLTEARNTAGEFYPLKQRLAVLTSPRPNGADASEGTARPPSDPAILVNMIWHDVITFAGEIQDDVAVLAFDPDLPPV